MKVPRLNMNFIFKGHLISPKIIIRGTAGCLISIFLIWYLLKFLKLDVFYLTLQSIRYDLALMATAVYFATYFPRAYRFQLLLAEKKIHLSQHLSVVGIHTFLNHIFPFRTGELSYLYLRKKYHQISYQEATANLFTIRVYDLIALGFWIIVLSPLIIHQLHIYPDWELDRFIIKISGLAFSLLLISLCWFVYAKRKTSLVQQMVNYLLQDNVVKNKFMAKIYRFAGMVLSKSLLEIEGKTHFRLFVASMYVWALLFCYFYVMFLTVMPSITFIESLIPSLGAIVGNLLPINGIGSIGAFDAGLVIGQSGLGIANDVSVSVAFLIHAHAILSGCMSALISWFVLSTTKSEL